MAQQTTLSGEFIVVPPQSKKKRLEPKAKEVFKRHMESQGTLASTRFPLPRTSLTEMWLDYKMDEGMFCKLCMMWAKVPRSDVPIWTTCKSVCTSLLTEVRLHVSVDS